MDSSAGLAVSPTKAIEKWEDFHRAPTLLNMVIENIPAMVAVKEAAELRFVLFNRAAEELIGVTRDEALGQNDFDLFPREQAEFFVGRDREVLASGQALTIPEEQIATKHKGVRILRTTKMPVLDASGRPQYLLAMSEDITEHKRAEAALVASERRWAFALESAGQGVWEADILNNTVYYSPTWKRMRGIDVHEDVDSGLEAWLSRVHPDDREHIRQTIAKQNLGELPHNAIFGTGHTSFVSLLRLMPRRFKIDRQLVSPVARSDAQRQLVASIVGIGRTLGIQVVAEGVETAEQARVLGEIGCDFLQGFAYGRPMPAPELVQWLRSKTWRLAAG